MSPARDDDFVADCHDFSTRSTPRGVGFRVQPEDDCLVLATSRAEATRALIVTVTTLRKNGRPFSLENDAVDGRLRPSGEPGNEKDGGFGDACQGAETVIVNNIHLFCGKAIAAPTPADNPSAIFDAPRYKRYAPPPLESQRCPSGEAAVGVHGRAGKWLDAMGLICDAPHITSPTSNARPVVKSLGKVGPSHPPAFPRPICEAARDARARNSPAAPNLEAQCRAANGRGGPGR